jgi:hypothetical protein
MPVTEAQKRANAKYRSKIFEKYILNQRIYAYKHWDNNRETIKEKHRLANSFLRQAIIFRQILI